MASQVGPFSDQAMAEYERGVWQTTLTRLQDNLGIAGGEYKSAARGYRAGSVSHADWQKAWAKKQAAQDALQDHTGQYLSVFTGLEVLGYGRPDSVSGAIWEGAKYGVSGGGSIVSNTFTFGAADYFGLTTSYAYQGAGFDESRIASIASRELLITAGTAGLGHVLKGGSAVYTAKTVVDTARGATALRAIASPLARAGARFAGQSLTTMRIARGLQTTSLAYEGYQLGNSGVSAYEAFSREEYGWGLFHVGTGALSAWGLGESVRTFGSSTRAYRDMLSATGNRTLVGLNGKAVRLGNIELYPQGFYSPSLPGVRSAQPSAPRGGSAYNAENFGEVLGAWSRKHGHAHPDLPKYDGTTHGVLYPTNPPGPPVPLTSTPSQGSRFPYSQADGHVETNAARHMNANNIQEGTVYHNHPKGTCGNFNRYVPTYLDEGRVLRVIPPSNAVAPKPSWQDVPTTYRGNGNRPN